MRLRFLASLLRKILTGPGEPHHQLGDEFVLEPHSGARRRPYLPLTERNNGRARW